MRKILVLAILVLSPLPAWAQKPAPGFISQQVPHAELSGQGRMHYMTMDIYDASLFTPNGQWKADAPFALRLTYLRHLNGKQIADRSADEIKREGFSNEETLADWQRQMRAIFPNVDPGTSITGIRTASGATTFYKNGKQIGEVRDPDFAHWFFAIWLSRSTRDPDLRASLLHQKG